MREDEKLGVFAFHARATAGGEEIWSDRDERGDPDGGDESYQRDDKRYVGRPLL